MPIREARAGDIAAIQAIYAHHVLTGLASFETEPPDSAEIRRRFDAIIAARFPYLVYTDDDNRVLGYAYVNLFRTRAAYRYTVEDSIYVDPAQTGRGIGKALLHELVARCTTRGLHQMLAVIGDSANTASIGLHRACGFSHIGTMKDIGRKFDRWVDVVIMQRTLSNDVT